MDGIRRCALGFVNMYPGSIAQTAGGRIVLFVIEIMASFVQHVLRATQALLRQPMRVDSRMVVRILAIFPSGAAYFLDSPVDFGDCALIVTGNISSP
ncbi:MAG TPA: hypothetical protein VH302_16490 [Bryobacteraceae bacterium]|nr:hypothetical protein [Bryobacteraceae bacterium]